MRRLRGRDRVDHRGLPARVLQQHDPGAVERAIRARLRPVVLDELLGDRAQRHAQRAVGRGLALEAQIRERVQQRELVGRDEVAFGEQALKFPQKLELADRGGVHWSVLCQYAALSGSTQRMPPRGSLTSPW